MEKFLTIGALVDWCGEASQASFSVTLKRIVEENKVFLNLLELLEEVNPCGQEYYVHKDIILITYKCELNLLSFRKNQKLKVGTRKERSKSTFWSMVALILWQPMKIFYEISKGRGFGRSS